MDKKIHFPVKEKLKNYLLLYNRVTNLPVSYNDLMHYNHSFPIIDKKGKDTLWESVMYDSETTSILSKGLTSIYSLLKTEGDISVMEHLQVERIDYCTFGNSNPFKIRIVNQLNDNFDHFYVKKADASRIYGLELEDLLSPNRINYLVDENTLIEEHIAGIPGDVFINEHLNRPQTNKVRIAKEFVKFNERCFVRLLGDMRSYNYVIDITPDFEEEQYRIRAIDFDQQSYEGNKSFYLPQFFKENNAFVQMCIDLMTPETFKQYQLEERSLIARRLRTEKYKVKDLLDCMRKDEISTREKVFQLKNELSKHHGDEKFLNCNNMGDIARANMLALLKISKNSKSTSHTHY